MTVPTIRPSYGPTLTPSTSSYPSIIPSMSPTSIPTRVPSFIPSRIPSESPSSVPSATPSYSIKPTLRPSASAKPSSSPSISSYPSRTRKFVDTSMFVVEITSREIMDVVDTETITRSAEIFLTKYLKNSLPQESNFIKISLHHMNDERRRLNVSISLVYTGIAIFDSDIYPESIDIDDMIMEAFTTRKTEFLSILQSYDNQVFAKVVHTGATSVKAEKPYLSISTIVVIVLVSVTVGSVILKLNIDFVFRKRSQRDLVQNDPFYTDSNIQQNIGVSHQDHLGSQSNVHAHSIDIHLPSMPPIPYDKDEYGMINEKIEVKVMEHKYNRDNTEDVEFESSYFTKAHTRQY